LHAVGGGPAPASQEAIPFAVIGSEQTYNVNNQEVRARKYHWGFAEGAPKRSNTFGGRHKALTRAA